MDYLKVLNLFNNTPAKKAGSENLVDPKISSEQSLQQAARISREQSLQEVARSAAHKAELDAQLERERQEAISIEQSIEIAKSIEAQKSIELENLKQKRIQEEKPELKTKKLDTKVSFIMQVNLEDYDGQVENPVDAFIAAIESFLLQSDKKCELVIVADGCIEAMRIYFTQFSQYENIKFAYIDKDVNKKHTISGDNVYYRVEARNVGIMISTGEWITYLNANDLIVPHAVEIIKMQLFRNSSNISFIFGQSKYMKRSSALPPEKEFKTANDIEFKPVQGKWAMVSYKSEHMNLFDCEPGAYIHHRDCPVTWKDSTVNKPAFEIARSMLTPENISNIALLKQAYYINAK